MKNFKEIIFNLLGIKKLTGVGMLKKRCGITKCIEKRTDMVKYLTKDGGLVTIQRFEIPGDNVFIKRTTLSITKTGGQGKLDILSKDEKVTRFVRDYMVTDRSVNGFYKRPHVEVWDFPYKGYDCVPNPIKYRNLPKSAYQRNGFLKV